MNTEFANTLLDWYNKNARILPWRISPHDRAGGVMPNPYHVWLSEMMLQQTTVTTVINYYHKFIAKWHSIHDLANATQDEIMTQWAGLGYYSRARNLHKTANIIVDSHQGIFPDDEKELIKLAGIGRYSAASIAAIAFDKSAAVMDGNIERIISRLYCVKNPFPASKSELYGLTKTLTPRHRSGDYAQAMMDLGATICTPKKPACGLCPIKESCQAYKTDNPEKYPVKMPKIPKPTHRGSIFLIVDKNNNILVEKRPNNGLFGGMEIFPYVNPHEIKNTTKNNDFAMFSIDKAVDKIVDKFNIICNDQKFIGCIKHIFTHFTFYADVILLRTDIITQVHHDVRLVAINHLNTVALPTLMQKALKFYDALYDK